MTKLKRRIADIERLRTENIRHDDDRVENVEHAVRDTILEEFGKDSPEFQRHAYFKVDDGLVVIRVAKCAPQSGFGSAVDIIRCCR